MPLKTIQQTLNFRNPLFVSLYLAFQQLLTFKHQLRWSYWLGVNTNGLLEWDECSLDQRQGRHQGCPGEKSITWSHWQESPGCIDHHQVILRSSGVQNGTPRLQLPRIRRHIRRNELAEAKNTELAAGWLFCSASTTATTTGHIWRISAPSGLSKSSVGSQASISPYRTLVFLWEDCSFC